MAIDAGVKPVSFAVTLSRRCEDRRSNRDRRPSAELRSSAAISQQENHEPSRSRIPRRGAGAPRGACAGKGARLREPVAERDRIERGDERRVVDGDGARGGRRREGAHVITRAAGRAVDDRRLCLPARRSAVRAARRGGDGIHRGTHEIGASRAHQANDEHRNGRQPEREAHEAAPRGADAAHDYPNHRSRISIEQRERVDADRETGAAADLLCVRALADDVACNTRGGSQCLLTLENDLHVPGATCRCVRGGRIPASSRADAGLPRAPPWSGECGVLGSPVAWHPPPSR